MRHKLNRLYARVKVKEGTSVTNKVLAPFFLTVIDKTENLLLNSSSSTFIQVSVIFSAQSSRDVRMVKLSPVQYEMVTGITKSSFRKL